MKLFPAWFVIVFSVTMGTVSFSALAAQPAGSFTNQITDGVWHSVVVPPHPGPPVRWYDRINVLWWFGNRNEPVAPDWYEPHSRFRNLEWHLRNPFSNFSWYVIGVADKQTVRSGKYPLKITRPGGGWNFAVTKWKCLRLPFVSYNRGRLVFYLGWREHGNFGIALRSNSQEKKPAVGTQSSPAVLKPK
jgi:hypothetical protein